MEEGSRGEAVRSTAMDSRDSKNNANPTSLECSQSASRNEWSAAVHEVCLTLFLVSLSGIKVSLKIVQTVFSLSRGSSGSTSNSFHGVTPQSLHHLSSGCSTKTRQVSTCETSPPHFPCFIGGGESSSLDSEALLSSEQVQSRIQSASLVLSFSRGAVNTAFSFPRSFSRGSVNSRANL